MTKSKRRRRFIDRRVQGALALRPILYWLLFGVYLTTLAGFVIRMTDPNLALTQMVARIWEVFGPALVAALFLLPVVVFDVVRLTHRFAGPVHRLRRVMRDAIDGHPVEPVRLRKTDYWQEFADEVNELIAVLEAARANSSDASSPGSSAQLAVEPGKAVAERSVKSQAATTAGC